MYRLSTLVVLALVVAFFAAGYSVRASYELRYQPKISSLPSSSRLTAYSGETARTDVGRRSDIDMRPMETFYSVLRLLREHYVDSVDDSQRRELAYGALKNMLDSIKDPNTRFLEPEQRDMAERARQGKFHGAGAVFGVQKIKNDDGSFEQLLVVAPLPGSPAEQAGLRSGDIITELDGKTVLPYDPYQRANKLIKAQRNGEITRDELLRALDEEESRIRDGISFQKAGDKLSAGFSDEIELTLERDGQPVKVKVASADLTVDPVLHNVKNGIGYIDINLFSTATWDDFVKALADVEKKGATGLVIDVRGNPGGSVDMALQVARLFAPEKGFAVVAKSSGKREVIKIPPPRADAGVNTWIRPVVVLVDKGTAAAAELFAGALRDAYGAKLVGTWTFGQAHEVTMLPQRDGSAVEMTTGKFLTPKGTDFNIKGLKPDFEVEGSEAQLERARALVQVN